MTARNGWRRLDGKLKYLAPVFMLLLLLYLYTSLVQPVVSTQTKNYLGIAIVSYFGFELFVKYMITDNFRLFIREYWLEIILLVPFLKGLRLLGAVGKLLKAFKYVKYLPYVQKVSKLPKLATKTKRIIIKYLVPFAEPDSKSEKDDNKHQ